MYMLLMIQDGLIVSNQAQDQNIVAAQDDDGCLCFSQYDIVM